MHFFHIISRIEYNKLILFLISMVSVEQEFLTGGKFTLGGKFC